MKKNGIEITGLQSRLSELELSLKQRENEVSVLTETLNKKNLEITQLNTTVAQKNTVIESKDKEISIETAELNKGFVICGTVKDLQTKGVVTKEGGFIGIGKKQVLHFADNVFTQVDVTQMKSITVNSKNVKLVTNHPANSYEFKKDLKGIVIAINITNPAIFWKVSKYAVVETKN